MAKKKVVRKTASKDAGLRVLPRLKKLLPALPAEAYAMLERNIQLEGGAKKAIWLWGDVIVDGHNRYEICMKHGLPFKTEQVYKDCESVEQVEYEIYCDVQGQRNIDGPEKNLIRGKMAWHLVENEGMKPTAAIAEVAKRCCVSERQVFKGYKRYGLLRELDSSLHENPLVSNLVDKHLKQLGTYPESQQKSIVKQAKDNLNTLRARLDDLKAKEDAKTAKKTGKDDEGDDDSDDEDDVTEHSSVDDEDDDGFELKVEPSKEKDPEKLRKAAVDQLGIFQVRMREAAAAAGVSEKKLAEARFYLEKLDTLLDSWK